jgi:phosphotriesterase-related protein
MPAGTVMTVLGPVSPDELGATLIHEHVLFDLSVYHRRFLAEGGTPLEGPLRMEQFHVTRHNFPSSLDNTLQRDVDVAVKELARYKERGGGTVVEVTSIGLAPDPTGLAEIARQTGLNVVAGTGYYIGASHPPELTGKSVEQVADEMLRDFSDGFSGTTIRAGVVGEIGTSEPLTPTEDVVLRASGQVQAQTGAAIVLHPDSFHRSYEPIAKTLDILERSGAALDKVVISHCDDRLHRSYESYRRLAGRGCTLAFDTFGKEQYYPVRGRQYPNDQQRVDLVARLVADGLAPSLTLAHDVCYKMNLVAWGGDGYDHIPRNVLPRLRGAGVSEDAIRQMTVENPKRLLPLKV